jgi:hypothetical protein
MLILYGAAVALPVWLFVSLKFLKSNERGMVLRLGKLMSDYAHPRGPGFHWVFWPIDMLIRWNVYTGKEQIFGAEGKAEDTLGEGRTGLVSIAGERWMATSSERIPFGQNVRVVGFDGPNLQVALGSHPRSEKELADERIESLRKLVKSSPDSAFLHWNLAALYEAEGDSQVAFEEYQKAEKLDPNIRELIAAVNAGKASRKN